MPKRSTPLRAQLECGTLEIAIVNYASDEAGNSGEPVILSIQMNETGNCTLSSSDGCIGGTFVSRQAALREIDNQICLLGRLTVIVIKPEIGARPR